MKNRHLALMSLGIVMLALSTAAGMWLILYYQQTDVVIRTTFVDGRVEVVGGRVPWRNPDFSAETTPSQYMKLRRRKGDGYEEFRIRKVEMWFRDAQAREKVRQVFTALEKLPTGSEKSER